MNLFPNPLVDEKLTVEFDLKEKVSVSYIITNTKGQIIQESKFNNLKAGKNKQSIHIQKGDLRQALNLTFIFDNRYYSSHKFVVQ